MGDCRFVAMNIGQECRQLSAPPGFSSGKGWRHPAAITLIALIHLAVFWMMAAAMRGGAPSTSRSGEMEVQLLSLNLGPKQAVAPPLDRSFLTPENVVVPEPEITIAPQQPGSEGADAIASWPKLPPRLDPGHINERPELPHTLGMVGALALELRILVLPDGSVGDAEVIKSTGEPEIDRLAIETVKNSWRYLPASIGGRPIEAWTTVIVRFAAI